MLAIGGGIGEERELDGIEGRGSEEAFGGGERSVESEENGGDKVKQRETEEL